MSEIVKFSVGDTTVELPVIEGSEGERALDIRKLRAQTGLITFDPGYANTGACRSDITFINGEEGILQYRGYPIEELAEKSTFLEVAWLLIYGELPTRDEIQNFRTSITKHTMIHEDFKKFYGALPKDAHPMASCSAAIGALSTFYPDSLDPRDPVQVQVSIERLLAKFPTMAAYACKHSKGQPFLYPKNSLTYIENFLHLLFGTPCAEYELDPVLVRAIDQLLILHADHEQNCSTSTVRLVGSSMCNLFSSLSSAINSLWGPLHGGANQAVIEMLEAIRDRGLSVTDFVERAKQKDSSERLMGFGHRVYKNFDPRAKVIKKICVDVLAKLDTPSELLDIAMELEQIALSDEYFIERKLYPNVDFYSGIIYHALGIEVQMFTVLFAMGRLPGWIAHWSELHTDPDFRIGRPRQIYVGETKRSYVPMENR